MSNLIITIISIALVAVAALMGAYYGGAAFLQGGAKANANAIASQAQQLASAWVAYSLDHGGLHDLPAGWPSLVPGYVSAIPVPPVTGVVTTNVGTWSGWGAVNLSDDNTAQYPATNLDSTFNALAMVTSDPQVCTDIASREGGTNIIAHIVPFGDGSTITLSGTKMNCENFSGENVIFYRVF